MDSTAYNNSFDNAIKVYLDCPLGDDTWRMPKTCAAQAVLVQPEKYDTSDIEVMPEHFAEFPVAYYIRGKQNIIDLKYPYATKDNMYVTKTVHAWATINPDKTTCTVEVKCSFKRFDLSKRVNWSDTGFVDSVDNKKMFTISIDEVIQLHAEHFKLNLKKTNMKGSNYTLVVVRILPVAVEAPKIAPKIIEVKPEVPMDIKAKRRAAALKAWETMRARGGR